MYGNKMYLICYHLDLYNGIEYLINRSKIRYYTYNRSIELAVNIISYSN